LSYFGINIFKKKASPIRKGFVLRFLFKSIYDTSTPFPTRRNQQHIIIL